MVDLPTRITAMERLSTFLSFLSFSFCFSSNIAYREHWEKVLLVWLFLEYKFLRNGVFGVELEWYVIADFDNALKREPPERWWEYGTCYPAVGHP